jgi:ATP-dependent Clp protease ATP-binding subunit ClpB
MAYSQELIRATEIASSIAKEYSHKTWGAPHLLRAILHNEIGLSSLLTAMGKDIYYFRDWADVRIENYPKSSGVASPIPDQKVEKVFEVGDLVRVQLSKDTIDSVCILIALIKPDLVFTAEQLRSLPIIQKELLEIEQVFVSGQKDVVKDDLKSEPKSSEGALSKFCTEKTASALQGRLDPIIGRDKELRMIIEVFGRRTKPNVILIGEPGVGKSALVDGLAINIVEGKVTTDLKEAKIYELDNGSLVAGASYKGEVEDRLKKILQEIKGCEKAILFIDEIHVLLDNRGSFQGVANLLKPELARGEITVLGATTPEEYQKYIEGDEAFSRRFEVIRVEEPDSTTAYRMLKNVVPLYEKHHQITLTDDAIKESIHLSKRYIKDRKLPDAAIDLIDRTMASVKTIHDTSLEDLKSLANSLDALNFLNESEQLEELKWFYRQLKNKINPILLAQLTEDTVDVEKAESPEELKMYLKDLIGLLNAVSQNKKQHIDKTDIASMIASKTGIPLGKLQSKERDKLLGIEEVLKRRVVGQDQAVKALSEAIMESRSGLLKAGQPIGSFFLLGPTGTGKTELAKSLADFLFNDESFLIRFDMSEFKEEHSAALLYGAPPGYVGYEEGGLLVNKIRQKPYSVVLFDEIEKAHPSVFDIFLQILDEGKIHDRLGKEGDFSNAVVLFTSNIGSEFVAKKFDQKETPSTTELMEIMSRHFRPEFLARLTEIVPFAPISTENVVKIFEIHLKGLTEALNKQGITLEISDKAKEQIALEGFTPKYGVRPLKGVIRNKLRRPISKMIIAGGLTKGSILQIECSESGELIWETLMKD